MTDPFVRPPSLPGPEPESPVHIDPTIDEAPAARWEVRAAQWRARELAEALFGGEVVARLRGQRTRGALRGLLHLEVPFTDLATHRRREEAFLASAEIDPVLARVPLVVVFSAAGE